MSAKLFKATSTIFSIFFLLAIITFTSNRIYAINYGDEVLDMEAYENSNLITDFVWTGGSADANTDWNDANNWSTEIVPSFGEKVVVPNIAPLTNYPIIDEFVEIGSIVIEDNAEVTVVEGGDFILSFNTIGIDIEIGASLNIEEGGKISVIESSTRGINVEGTLNVSGELFVSSNGIGINVASIGIVNDNGFIQINQGYGVSPEKTGLISVVNFLEIQNGGTFEVSNGDTLLIDGTSFDGEKKIGLTNGNIGIKIFDGGTFTSEVLGVTQVINITGTGIENAGNVINNGDMTVTAETTGITTFNTFTNDGSVGISKPETIAGLKKTGGASVVNFLEIQNGGTFSMLSSSSLLINGEDSGGSKMSSNKALINDTGIAVNSGGTFISEPNSDVDVINMIGASIGVSTSGTINSNGNFTITTENIGMKVSSNTVDISGALMITTVEAPSKLMNKTGAASVVNFLEIQNGGTFEILKGGEVIVDGLTGAAKKLNNDTGVTIHLGGELIINNEANLQIKNIIGQGTGMRNEGEVNNYGTIDIRDIGGNGLENTKDFNNNSCSVFSTDSKVMNTTSGDLTNVGLISSTYGANGEQHENDGMFLNEGTIEDPNNAFVNIIGNPIIESGNGNFTNYTLFKPLFTCFGEVIENATNKPFDTEGIYDVNMWYTDISLTQEAGVFEYSEILGINRFTPDYTLLGAGTHLLFVSIDSDNFAECGARNVVLVQLTIYPLPEIAPIDQSICSGDILTTPLAVEDNGEAYSWYDQETGGVLLTTGTTYLPNPQPTANTTYWVEAIDNTNNCQSEVRTAVTLTIYDNPTTPSIASNTELISCINTTTLDVGTYPSNHTYLWSTTATTQTIAVTNLAIYTITVTNENNCSSTANMEVTENLSFTVNIEGDTDYCLENETELDADSYSNNDTYIWSTTETTQTIGVTAGSYTVTVTNADGCIGTDEVEVVEFCCEAMAGTVSLLNQNICAINNLFLTTNNTHQMAAGYDLHYLLVDNSTGIIEYINTDGVFSGIAPDGYEFYSYVEFSSNPPNPSPVGSSNLLLSDIGNIDMGCYELSTPQTTTVPNTPSLSSTFTTTQGAVDLMFIANLTITGGTPPYNIEFSNTQGGVITLVPLLINQYAVRYPEGSSWELSITDDNGCESPNWSIGSADNPNVLITDVLITKESCVNESDGAINITVSGGMPCIPSPSYTYNWSGPNSFSATTQDITDLVFGTYHVTVADCDNGSFANDYQVQRKPPRSSRGRGRTIDCGTDNSNKAPTEYADEAFLEVYPNPFNYYTIIEFGMTQTGIVDIGLYALDGQKVRGIYHNSVENEMIHRIHFEAENIQSGMYLLQLKTENGEMVVKKLMLQ
ncbi:MAG: T9SS type A sorting domain-containing protein [Chitinophagales bacterium]